MSKTFSFEININLTNNYWISQHIFVPTAKAKEEEKQEPKPSLSPLVEEDLEDFPFMFPPTPFDASSASARTTPMNFNSIAASFASPSPFVECV